MLYRKVSHLIVIGWACPSYRVGLLHNMMCYAVWLTKYPLTSLHKDAVIGGLKRFDYFRRGSLSGSLLIL